MWTPPFGLRDIDFNLLIVFSDLLNSGRVNTTAERLGLTQPAVSNALARLRRLLGDELFVRTPQGMQPTPFAQTLAEPVSHALGTIHSALNHNAIFDPARSRQNFTIAMTDIGEIHFLPHRNRRPVAVIAQRTGMLLAKRPVANLSIGDCLGIIAWDV